MPHSAPRIRNDERQCIPSKFYSALDVAVIAYVKAQGIARYQACKLLQIKVRRIELWKERIQRTGSIAYGKTGAPAGGACHHAGRTEGAGRVCGAGRDG